MSENKKQEVMEPNRLPLHITAPQSYIFLGVRMDIHLSAEQTNGEFSMIEAFMPPGGDGGLHVHSQEDETIHVVEGQLEVTVGDQTFSLKKGETSFAPRNIPHRIKNLGLTEARTFLINTPGGFDRFVSTAGIAGRPSAQASMQAALPPTPEQITELLKLAAEFGVTVMAPPGA